MENEDETSSRRRPSFLMRLWRGDVGLGVTYWIFGVLVGIIIRIIYMQLMYDLGGAASSVSEQEIGIIGWIFISIASLYAALFSVSLWRSATKHVTVRGGSRITAGLARAVCVLAWLSILAAFGERLSPNPSIPPSGPQYALDAYISGLNRDLPKKIDSITELMKISVKGGDVSYLYSIDRAITDTNVFKKVMRPRIVQEACGPSGLSNVLASGYTLHYIYTGTNEQTAEITVNESSCAPHH